MTKKLKQSPKLPGTLRQFKRQQQNILQIGAGSAIKRPKLPGTLGQLTAQQQTVSQIGAGSANEHPKLPGTLGQLTIQEEELWKASKHAKFPKLPKGLSQ